MDQIISNEQTILKKLLQNISDKENLKNSRIKIKALPCTGSNYTAALFLATIEDEEDRKLKLFAKVANLTENIRSFMPITEMYKRESFVYEKLTKIFCNIQNKHKVPEQERFKFCKFYDFNDKFLEETLILDNLTAKGYVVPDRFVPMDWKYAEKAVKELAKFHALSFAFEREQPKLYEDTVKAQGEFVFSSDKLTEDEGKKYVSGLTMSILEKIHPENRDRFENFMAKYSRKMWRDQFKPLRRSVLTHGDYRHSNILVKREEGEITSLIPVDYQTVHYGSPVNDLIYFIFTGSDRKFREKYYEKLLAHYHRSLEEFLALLDLNVNDVYRKEDFYLDMEDRCIYGLLLSIFVLPYILVDEKPEFEGKIEDYSVKQGSTFSDRFNGIMEDYLKWGFL